MRKVRLQLKPGSSTPFTLQDVAGHDNIDDNINEHSRPSFPRGYGRGTFRRFEDLAWPQTGVECGGRSRIHCELPSEVSLGKLLSA
jgi:hypothetical protein